jgi:hypothetical protein
MQQARRLFGAFDLMLIDQPDYPHIVLSFTYRGWIMELDQSELDGQTIYAVWATHEQGSAVAVPYAPSRTVAIQRAKQWVDRRLV